MLTCSTRILHSLLVIATCCAIVWADAPASATKTTGGTPVPREDAVEFNRDILPILSDACFRCHGPDAKKRKAALRLDTEAGAFTDLDHGKAFVRGNRQQSLTWQRITATDRRKQMPPRQSPRQLTEREKTLIGKWIDQGAKWQKHWAFIPPRRATLPVVKQRDWLRNPIDAFILARLERDGLSPSPEADRVTMLRRLTLDLTGLPPTPIEVDAFLADRSPGAYEHVVDRLLASPRHGERMAIRWLEAARYADTNGYQSDGERSMWRWRDRVIDSFNENLPYDRFTIEQLAGDLLPGATLEQVIASGFNRNHRGNAEGGIIPEEYAVEYVADRVETTATVWLGLTMTCCRCHDHKYDPLAQKEFYQLFAFFNNVPERGKAIKYGNSPPVVFSPTRRQQEKLDALDRDLAEADVKVKTLDSRMEKLQSEWEKTLKPDAALEAAPEEGLLAHFPLDGSAGKARFVDGIPTFGPGRTGRAADFDGSRFVDAGDVGPFGFYDRFSLAAWVQVHGKRGTIVSRMLDVPQGAGYAVTLVDGRLQVNLVVRWLDDALRVETETLLAENNWQHVLVSYDGSRVASGVKVYLDGREMKLRVLLDDLNQTFAFKEPFRIGAGGGPQSRFLGRIADVRVYSRVIEPEEAAALAAPQTVQAIAALPADRRTPGQVGKLRTYYLALHAPAEIRQASRVRHDLRKKRQQLLDHIPTTMVMREMPAPRPAHVLVRGQYDRPGAKVSPDVPAIVSSWPDNQKRDRLGLARWLVDPDNPLTARVAVNRAWQMVFGNGIVKTVDDFGAQGEWPSHPELLDWLAVEFRESGWNSNGLLRLIVTSATYRQSSKVSLERWKRDPENRLLSRGPRIRLSAEMIRDQALAASGLLVERLGGPSARPYQPGELWRELADTEYQRDKGEGLYRRGLYTFWKRTVAPPSMMTFDAAGREACMVRETRTNTPLQALNLLNDVTYVEASRVLAQRILRAGSVNDGLLPVAYASGSLQPGSLSDTARMTFAFRLVISRPPQDEEMRILLAGLARHRAHYRSDRAAALKLASAGEAPRVSSLDPAELAAWTAVCGVILNLDEAITKE
jgi:hypothetical protein